MKTCPYCGADHQGHHCKAVEAIPGIIVERGSFGCCVHDVPLGQDCRQCSEEIKQRSDHA